MPTQNGGIYIWPQTSSGGGTVASQTFTSYVQVGAANYATTGDIRVTNNTTIVAARNAANSANINALATDASNNIIIGDAAQTATILHRATVSHAMQVTGSNRWSISDVDLISYSLPLLMHATNAATTGEIRTRNNTTIVAARNAANAANIPLLGTNANDQIVIAASNHEVVTGDPASGAWEAIRVHEVTTTDATVTTGATYTPPNSSAGMVVFTVIGTRSDGTNEFMIDVQRSFSKSSGAVVAWKAATRSANEDADSSGATCDADIDDDGAGVIRCRVTGKAGQTWNWTVVRRATMRLHAA